jgi:hypothetical protein
MTDSSCQAESDFTCGPINNITQSGLITAIAFVAKMNVLTWKSVMQAGVVRPGFTEALPTSAVRIVIASNRATTAAIQRLLSFKFDEVQSRKYVAMPGFVQIAKNIP